MTIIINDANSRLTATSRGRGSSTSSTNKYRELLNPIPILDRKLLLQSLPEDVHSVLKPNHLDIFYQALHRANYPDLKDFISNLLLSYSAPSKVITKLPSLFLSHILRNCQREHPSDNQCDYYYTTITSRIVNLLDSVDKSTTKLAIQLQDGHVVEAVIMRHCSGNNENKHQHVTLCVSSQVGCAMKCVFCATGTMGMRGNLTSGEILEQLVHASRVLQNDKIRNVVFMGMGEPLNNYHNVVAACRAMVDRRTWSMQHHHVTVSTVGIINKMKKLTKDAPFVNLALSLHAPNQSMREKIVPTAKYYPIDQLMDALDQHSNCTFRNNREATQRMIPATRLKRKRAMIEYVMLNGDTSSLNCAHELGKLCENRNVIVNLIPYNPTVSEVNEHGTLLSSPSYDRIVEFQRIVQSYGCFCFVRKTMGQDISGACGQLAVQEQSMAATEMKAIQDIEDVLSDAVGTLNKNELIKRKVSFKRNRLSTVRAISGISKTEQYNTPKAVSVDSNGEKSSEVDTITNSGRSTESFNHQQMPAISSKDSACHPDSYRVSQWILPLTIATSLSFACAVISGAILLTRPKR